MCLECWRRRKWNIQHLAHRRGSKMLVPFSPSFRCNMLTFICKNYDSTSQMSTGYRMRILCLLRVASKDFSALKFLLILPKTSDQYLQNCWPVQVKNKEQTHKSILSCKPVVNEPTISVKDSSICVSFQQHWKPTKLRKAAGIKLFLSTPRAQVCKDLLLGLVSMKVWSTDWREIVWDYCPLQYKMFEALGLFKSDMQVL